MFLWCIRSRRLHGVHNLNISIQISGATDPCNALSHGICVVRAYKGKCSAETVVCQLLTKLATVNMTTKFFLNSEFKTKFFLATLKCANIIQHKVSQEKPLYQKLA